MLIFRTVLFYAVLILQVRLMGKRQLSQMEPSEFVVTILIANLAAIPLEEPSHSVWSGLAPMAIVLAAERLLSWLSLKDLRLRRLLCGKPVILIENGRLIRQNLRRTRINLDELSAQLRTQGVLELQTVQYAILETNGALTVFPYPQFQPATAKDAGVQASAQELPYTIITDGQILWDNLSLLGRDRLWLTHYLSGKGCRADDVMLLTLTPKGKTCLIRRDIPGSDSKIP